MWQEIIVGMAVLAALYFVVRRYTPGLRKEKAGGCSGCHGCDSPAPGCGTSGKIIHIQKKS